MNISDMRILNVLADNIAKFQILLET